MLGGTHGGRSDPSQPGMGRHSACSATGGTAPEMERPISQWPARARAVARRGTPRGAALAGVVGSPGTMVTSRCTSRPASASRRSPTASAGSRRCSSRTWRSLRTDLLSTIAHELRTPLTAVRTSIGLLTDATSTPTDEQRRTLLETVERNADRMQRLIADILELTRFRAGAIRLQLRGFDASDLAHNVAASLTPVAAARGQALVVETPDTRLPVYGDHRRLEQALVNWSRTRSASRPRGRASGSPSPVATASPVWSRRGPRYLCRDMRACSSGSSWAAAIARVPRGVGRGPTALAIAQAHGGTIEVASAVGVGSVFRGRARGSPEETD